MPAKEGSTVVHSATTSATSAKPAIVWRWRVVDIVIASVLGVAFGIIFWLWGIGYLGPKALLEPLAPGVQGLLDGPWLLAGVVGALVIRKPGAAIYTEVLAAVVSALVGNQWGGFWTIEAGLVQGLGAEIIFLIFAYRVWSLPVAMLAGAGAAIAGGVNNLVVWFTGADAAFSTIYMICTTISGAILAGILGWYLYRALAATGALDRFASGRQQQARV